MINISLPAQGAFTYHLQRHPRPIQNNVYPSKLVTTGNYMMKQKRGFLVFSPLCEQLFNGRADEIVSKQKERREKH